MLISLTEYAKKHGKGCSTVREHIQRGNIKTARKIGKSYVIDSDEPWPKDRRLTTGKYKNWRGK